MKDLKSYFGSKVINAKPMTRAEYNQFRGWQLPADENGADEGYLVEYTDGGKANIAEYAGYISWSPSDVFDKAYRQTDGLTFGQAVELLKLGKKVSRSGWNGKGMFAYLVPENEYAATTEVAKEFFGDKVKYNAYLALKTANGTVSTWAPSCSDALAEDWQLA